MSSGSTPDEFYLVAERWKLLDEIGRGGYGIVMRGRDLHTSEEVAIKLTTRIRQGFDFSADRRVLQAEYDVHKILEDRNGDMPVGFPKVHYLGEYGNTEAVERNVNGRMELSGYKKTFALVMELLGSDVHCELEKWRRFDAKLTAMIGIQVLDRLEVLHEEGIVHCDLKLVNFARGRGSRKNVIYLIDFGLAEKYILPDGQHRPKRREQAVCTTYTYAGIRTHLRETHARKEDLEMLGYTMLQVLRPTNSLPWDDYVHLAYNEEARMVKVAKRTCSYRTLCKGAPVEMALYIKYVRGLGYDESPDYEYLRNLLDLVIQKRGQINDGVYDW